MSKTIVNFVDLVIALITGDDARATALKIQKKAKAALVAQIAVKKSVTLSLEDTVENCEEALITARLNGGNLITDTESYIRHLLVADNKLLTANRELTAHLDTIKFLEKELKLVS